MYSISEIFAKFKIKFNGVIHVGANDGGDLTYNINNNIIYGHYFEPVLSSFKKLEENCVKTNLTHGTNFKYYNVALGTEDKNIEMYTETDNRGESSSILEPALHLHLFPHIKFNSKEIVKLTTLDSFNIIDCNLLNVDTQGYELEVLKGSTKTLQYIDAIYIEVNRAEVYKGCPMIKDIINFVYPFGFTLEDVSWWEGGCWGDGLFVKTIK
jgi:FkbM family methyltransferase